MRKEFIRISILVFVLLILTGICLADYLTVPATAFRAWNTNPDSIYYVGTYSNNRYIYTEMQAGTSGYLYAPVYLPHGVRIDNMILFYRDNHATADIVCRLTKNYQLSDNFETLFQVETSGQSTAIQYLGDWSLNEGNRYINNNTHQYTVRIQLEAASSELKCYGVQIRYH